MNKQNETATTKKPASKPRRSKNKRVVAHAVAHISTSFNNTIIMISDLQGNALAITSAGACGFRGGKKGTAYAAQVAANQALNRMSNEFGTKKIDIYVRGIGQGRDSAIRTILNRVGIRVDTITDMTKIAHGGVRLRKARRV